MSQNKTKLRAILKWILWVFIVQFVLANISAAIYAYKFTHFSDPPAPHFNAQNVFDKTWKLFAGPSFYKITTEGVPPFPCENITLKTSGGIPIDCWYSSHDSSKGCVIFFHGITVNKSFLEHEASMFREWGYTILLVDFRAHGKSGGNTSSFGVEETDEVQQAFEFAQSKGNKKIILYGVSLGAGVCIKAVSEKMVQPVGIIADMPFGSLHDHLRSRAKVEGGFPAEPFGVLVTFWMGIERGYNGFNHDVAAYAKKVSCPILVEWGEKDRYVMKDEVERVYNNLASSNKKMIIYSNADHESFLQMDPNKWEAEMQGFLSSLK